MKISKETHALDYFGARYVNSHINEIENYLKDKRILFNKQR